MAYSSAIAVMAISLVLWGCSKPPSPETKSDAAAPPPQAAVSTESAGLTDEVLPPILKIAWKGDLDEIVKRRVVRVLLPFRRPEFFYMEGRPVGVLQET